MSHSFSRSWKSPAVVARERWSRILKARDHICPDSPFLPRIFDVIEHRRIMSEAELALRHRKAAVTSDDATIRAELAAVSGNSIESLAPFHNKAFTQNRAPVLAFQTIWAPSWRHGKTWIAPWPSVGEMKYEGDERIATASQHRRFLPVPRFPCDEPDISWSQVAFLPQYEMDDVQRIPNTEEAFFLTHKVEGVEVMEQEAESLIGKELLCELDPAGIYGLKKEDTTE